MNNATTARAARTVAATVLALVVFALVVELGGAGYYFVQNRRLVYLNDAATPAPAPEENDYK